MSEIGASHVIGGLASPYGCAAPISRPVDREEEYILRIIADESLHIRHLQRGMLRQFNAQVHRKLICGRWWQHGDRLATETRFLSHRFQPDGDFFAKGEFAPRQ